MKLLTGFTYYNGISDVSIVNTTVANGDGTLNVWDFPLNVCTLGEEVFEYGGKCGPYLVASGDVSENLIDWKLESVDLFNGRMYAIQEGGTLKLDIQFTSIQQLSCAMINKLAWERAKVTWGTNAATNFQKLNKIYWDGFVMYGTFKPYYRGTNNVVTEIDEIFGEFYTASMSFGGDLKTKCVVNITANETSLGFSTKTITLQFPDTSDAGTINTVHGTFQAIPRLKPLLYHYVKPHKTCFQELFGLNSIYAILDRLTRKYTVHINSSNTTASFTALYAPGLPYAGIDYKIIPFGLISEVKTSSIKVTGEYFKSNLSTKIFNTNDSTCNLESLLNDYYYGGDDHNGDLRENILVILYDEDEYTKQEEDFNGVSIFSPPPICVYNFKVDESPTTIANETDMSLSYRTNGLITNITLCHCGFNSNSFNTNVDAQMYSNDYNSKYFTDVDYSSKLNNSSFVLCNIDLISSPSVQSMTRQKHINLNNLSVENFGIIFEKFIVIDGIPRSYNDTHYLSGTMFFNKSVYFKEGMYNTCLYIGVRKLSSQILNKITHYSDVREYPSGQYDACYSDRTLMMTSEYTCFLNGKEYTSPTLAKYKNERKYFPSSDDVVVSLRDYACSVTRIDDAIYSIGTLQNNSIMSNYLWGVDFQDYVNEYCEYANLDVKYDDDDYEELRDNYLSLRVYNSTDGINYYQYNTNIRIMVYPTFATSASTNVVNYSGICINSNVGTVLLYHTNALMYNALRNMYDNNLLVTGNTYTFNATGLTLYSDGVIINKITSSKQIRVYNSRYIDVKTFNLKQEAVFHPGNVGLQMDEMNSDCLPTNDKLMLYNGQQTMYMYGHFLEQRSLTVKCQTIMKLDPVNLLFYIDCSVRIQILPSSYLHRLNFPSDFLETFTVKVGTDYTQYANYFPYTWASRRGEPHPIGYINNGIFIGHFRLYEQPKCPFSMTTMKIVFTFYLYDEINQGSGFEYNYTLYETYTCDEQSKNTGFIISAPYGKSDLSGNRNGALTASTIASSTIGSFVGQNTGCVCNKTTSSSNRSYCVAFTQTGSTSNYGNYRRVSSDFNYEGGATVLTMVFYKHSTNALQSFNPIVIARAYAANTTPTAYYTDYGTISYSSARQGWYMYRLIIPPSGNKRYALIGPNSATTADAVCVTGILTNSFTAYNSYTSSTIYFCCSKNIMTGITFKYASVEGYDDFVPNVIDF